MSSGVVARGGGPAAAGPRGDGHRRRAAAGAVGRCRGGGRTGGARAGPGSGTARAGGGGHRGARRWPEPRGAGPTGALGGRPWCLHGPAAGGGDHRTRARRRGPQGSPGAGTAPAVARAAAPAVTGRRPPGALARRPA